MQANNEQMRHRWEHMGERRALIGWDTMTQVDRAGKPNTQRQEAPGKIKDQILTKDSSAWRVAEDGGRMVSRHRGVWDFSMETPSVDGEMEQQSGSLFWLRSRPHGDEFRWFRKSLHISSTWSRRFGAAFQSCWSVKTSGHVNRLWFCLHADLT